MALKIDDINKSFEYKIEKLTENDIEELKKITHLKYINFIKDLNVNILDELVEIYFNGEWNKFIEFREEELIKDNVDYIISDILINLKMNIYGVVDDIENQNVALGMLKE